MVWMRCLGLVVGVASGCAAKEPSGGTSSSSGASATTSTGNTTGMATTSTGAASSEDTHHGSGDQTTMLPPDTSGPESSSGSGSGVEESSSGGLHSCPGTGYCVRGFDPNVSIHDNHDLAHTIEILREHVLACEERDYDIQGAADHSHIVTLLPGHYGEIDVGGQITVTSSEAMGHTHDVWSDCE